MSVDLNKIIHGVEAHRAYFYRVSLALVGFAIALHVFAEGQVAAVSELVAAVLGISGNGLASLNTSVKKK